MAYFELSCLLCTRLTRNHKTITRDSRYSSENPTWQFQLPCSVNCVCIFSKQKNPSAYSHNRLAYINFFDSLLFPLFKSSGSRILKCRIYYHPVHSYLSFSGISIHQSINQSTCSSIISHTVICKCRTSSHSMGRTLLMTFTNKLCRKIFRPKRGKEVSVKLRIAVKCGGS